MRFAGSRLAPLVLPALLLAACTESIPTTPGGMSSTSAALQARGEGQARRSAPIEGQYIIMFRKGTANAPGLANRLARENDGEVLHVYTHAFPGFAAKLNARAADALRRNPNVEMVEQDVLDEADPIEIEDGAPFGDEILDDDPNAITTQINPQSWGLDRIDQADRPLNQRYNYRSTGAGVNVYIIDSGIRYTHIVFGGRAVLGVDLVVQPGVPQPEPGGDCFGHGTHVAGTVGGGSTGVAKQTTLHSVRIFGCPVNGVNPSSPRSRTIAAVNWVIANHVKPAVVNMSLGGGNESFPNLSTLDIAVANGVSAGIVFAVAAGNETTNACTRSPANSPTAITVASSDRDTETQSSFSNFGTCVDLYGPGRSIFSSWFTTNNAGATSSGTSMATPHVAGVAALYLQRFPNSTPAQVAAAIIGGATPNKITNASAGTPNLLLHSLTPGNGAPVPAFAVPSDFVEGGTYTFDGTASSDPDGDPFTFSWTIEGTNRVTPTTSQLYADNGTYSATLTLTDIVSSGTVTKSFSVANAAPAASLALSAGSILSGGSVTATGSFTDAGVLDAPWARAITWGDGRSSASTTTEQGSVSATQSYLRAGTYTVAFSVTDKDGGAGTASAVLTVNRVPVSVDVRPGSSENPISLGAPAAYKIPAAILGSASLDVRDIVVASVEMGDYRVAVKKTGATMSSLEDVNGDGILDLVVHFQQKAMAGDGTLTASTTTMEIFADLRSGVQLRGTDVVKVVP